MSYTLIAFTVFSESCGRGHYKVYCKKGDTVWYLFDDDKTIKKSGDIALRYKNENIFAQVTSLYYFKNEEATMKKSAEKAKKMLEQVVDHGCDVDTEESEPLLVIDVAHSQTRGGEVEEEEENWMRIEMPTLMASETINGAYIFLSFVQHNNILRSHKIIFFGNRGGASLRCRGGERWQ